MKCTRRTFQWFPNGYVITVDMFITKRVPTNTLIDGKTYTLWSACKQNMVIANTYSNPKAEVAITPKITKQVVKPSSITSDKICTKSANEVFPTCCLSKKADTVNPEICLVVDVSVSGSASADSEKQKIRISMMLMIVFMIIFG